MDNLASWIKQEIIAFTHISGDNYLGMGYNEKAWEDPIVGFSRGDDPLYEVIKKDIGEFYWLPREVFMKTYSELEVLSGDLTVICWVLPQTQATREAQRGESLYPCDRWVRSRLYGEEFNKKLAKHIVNVLNESGYKAVVPTLSPYWENKKSERYGYASTWSERHAAFVSGLGTFGLSDGLITPVGKAVRCGSVVANVKIEPTKRPYDRYNEYCLYYINGSCMKCAERCPADAINKDGHDKVKCREYQRQVIADYTKKNYSLESTCCGICQTGTPCEYSIPVKLLRD